MIKNMIQEFFFCSMALGGLRIDGGFRMSCLDVYRFDVPMPRSC